MLTARRYRQSGTTMLEILVTLVILAFGLLGLAGLNAKIQALDMEAYQRAQAILLLRDITERIRANSANASLYVPGSTGTTYGSAGDMYGTDYNDAAACAGTTQVDKDICEISNMLKGAAESSSGTKLGAMIGARACVEQVVAPNPGAGACTPGSYRVTVAWQGIGATAAPALTCGATHYGSNEAYRRAIASTVTIGLPACI